MSDKTPRCDAVSPSEGYRCAREVGHDGLHRPAEPEWGCDPFADERRLRDVVCPQCRKEFELGWNDWSNKPATLQIRGCPSGGIYDVIISCPHCNYEEPL